jgi:hypothetical protein
MLIDHTNKAGIEVGDIVVDAGVVARSNISNTICEALRSSTANDKAAIGIFVSKDNEFDVQDINTPVLEEGELPEPEALNDPSHLPAAITRNDYTDAEIQTMIDQYSWCTMNALGEGQINVCGEGGDLEIGDLITTSNTAGKGMKQADDLIRNYTVAKCREAVSFSSPSEVKTVACIYMCG